MKRLWPFYSLAMLASCGIDDSLDPDLSTSMSYATDVTYDLADYILTNCSTRTAANVVGSEQFFTIPMGVSGGRGRFTVMKSTDGQGFEEWAVDANWFYIRVDSTWAYQNPPGSNNWCDTQCGNSNQYPCRRRWAGESGTYAYTVYHEPGNSAAAARWLPRRVDINGSNATRVSVPMAIKGHGFVGCAYCWTDFESENVTRTVDIRRHASWQSFSDVMEVHVVAGPGTGERYYYARGRGWVGFNNSVAQQNTVNSNTNPNFGCASYTQASVCSAMNGALADVIVQDITWTPSSPVVGSQVRFTAVVHNRGNATTGADVGVGFRVDGVQHNNFWNVQGPMTAGQTRQMTMDGVWSATAGGHSITAHVDDINRFPESDENNNVFSKNLNVGGALPDVRVTQLTWTPANPAPGTLVRFSARVRNDGNAGTGADVGVGFRINGVQNTDHWVVEGPMNAGQERVMTMWGQWSATAGTHTIVAHADDINRFPESNENNNTAQASLSVGSGNSCPCLSGVDNVCFYASSHWPACGVPAGGCTTNQHWVDGWNRYRAVCML